MPNRGIRSIAPFVDQPLGVISDGTYIFNYRLGLKTKCGLHAGECDVHDQKYRGLAVELAEEIARESGLNEVLVSRTVKDLVTGSGLSFTEARVVDFKKQLGEWRLFHVRT